MGDASSPAERKAILFTAGGIPLALRLSSVREIVTASDDAPEVEVRGAALTALPVAMALGLPAGGARFALVTETAPLLALKVEAVHGIVDLAATEVFQLPTRTLLPQPPPFEGAVVDRGVVALLLDVSTLGWVPAEPATEVASDPAELGFSGGRELLFSRAGRTYAVPVELLLQVLGAPRIFPVPLTPPSHRGLLYHERAIHPVFDLAVLYGDAPPTRVAQAMLLDAGGNAIAVAADRVLPAGEGAAGPVARPSWDLLFGGA